MTITADPTTPTGLDADLFKGLLRRQASTVTVVTARGEGPAGFTATSFTSVSLHPPLVSFCVARTSSSWPTVARAEHVAVHLLAADQQSLARRFATSGIDRFASPTAWRPGPHDVPILHGTLAWLLCRVVDRVAAGDHAVVLAEPLLGQHGPGTPLLYHDGRYAGLDEAPAHQPPRPTTAAAERLAANAGPEPRPTKAGAEPHPNQLAQTSNGGQP